MLHSRIVGTSDTFCKNPESTDPKISSRMIIARANGGSPDCYFTARTTSGVSSVVGCQQMK
ncbi:MAG: hypothetical protein DLM72_21395 [Candidatus Nitrosopolaris wilkensis]|nr:MAG: hypothetical protein DLM72_21395 [Candidatus Nitrosopolaris wilkensis]